MPNHASHTSEYCCKIFFKVNENFKAFSSKSLCPIEIVFFEKNEEPPVIQIYAQVVFVYDIVYPVNCVIQYACSILLEMSKNLFLLQYF